MKNKLLVLSILILFSGTGFYPSEKTERKPAIKFYGHLPVELVYFDPYVVSNGVLLKFGTATEVSNYGFDIERADTNMNFSAIGFVEGSGNSNSPKNYEYLDTLVEMTGIVYYRLKQIDFVGSFEYSDTAVVDFVSSVELTDNTVPENFFVSNAYPNPFNPSTKIDFMIPQTSDIKIEIFNLTGEVVKEIKSVGLKPGTYSVNLSLNEFVSGTYLVRFLAEKYSSTKKIILLK
jgi:hypothetical protein